MQTRDNAQSISGTAATARGRLGEIIAFYRKDRDWLVRDVAKRCKVPPAVVEEWERGKTVPTADEWKALCRGVNRALNGHNEAYQRARKEAEDDARMRAEQTRSKEAMRQDTKINTALADKLGTVKITDHTPPPAKAPPTISIVPTPQQPPREIRTAEPSASEQLGVPVRGFAADGRKLIPVRPPGSDTTDARLRRRDYVRRLLITSPNKRTQGADSVLEHVRREFGIGISPDTVEEIREELRTERIKAEIMAGMPAPAPPTKPAMAAQLLEHIATPVQPTSFEVPVQTEEPGDLTSAVQLILEALPGLQTFTISVDEHGEASVDYQIRKVRVETVGGSIKVKR